LINLKPKRQEKRNLILLFVIVSFSCNNEKIYNEKENVGQKLPEEKSMLHDMILKRLSLIIFIRHRQGQKKVLVKLQKNDTISNNANIATKNTLNIHTTKHLPQ